MLETSIAVAILGVGLIMVAAIFPVSLSQHQTSVDQAAAVELVTKAEALLKARLDPTQLWIDPTWDPNADSPWYLLPTVNVTAGSSTWDPMLQGTAPNDNIYANLASDFDRIYGPQPPVRMGNFPDYLFASPEFPTNRQKFFSGLDVLSDRLAARPNDFFSPFTDAELQDAPNHYVWYGFYRRLANGGVKYAVAVCKQRRNQLFAEQDMSAVDTSLATLAQTPFSKPIAFNASRRLPVPWRVSVGCVPDPTAGYQLSNRVAPQMLSNAGEGIGSLAPPGSKLMIQGATYENGVPRMPVHAGRLLTVANVVNVNTINVLEDTSDLPTLNFTNGVGSTFDVWVFPPAIEGNAFSSDSPLVLWRTNL